MSAELNLLLGGQEADTPAIFHPQTGGPMGQLLRMPPAKEAQESKASVLVVGVDGHCAALAARRDPNVLFWSFRQAVGQVIPKSVKALWVAPDAPAQISNDLLGQISKRQNGKSVELWERVGIFSLSQRLKPFWEEERNSSLIKPLGEDDSVLTRGTPAQEALLKRKAMLKEARDRFEERQATPVLRNGKKPAKSGRKSAAKQPVVPNPHVEELPKDVPPVELPSLPVAPVADLSALPALDRQIYESYLRFAGESDQVQAVAEEFGFPKANVARIINRVQTQLQG
jgi:hypothetical protein